MSKEKIDPVNLSLGDKFSAYAGKLTRTTHNNSPYVSVDHEFDSGFRSETPFEILHPFQGCKLVVAPDGIGTKVILIDACFGYRNAARDLIAMTAGDITRYGGLPLVFSNVLDVSTLGEDDTSQTFQAAQGLVSGLVETANKVKFACIKGETAELSVCVSNPNPESTLKFNWAGFMIGIVHRDKIITGNSLARGQVVMALREYGFRSNGISAVRGALQKIFGKDWYTASNALEYISQAAVPSTIYDDFLTTLNGWYNSAGGFEPIVKIHLISHLSGGSFKAKFFEDVLKKKGFSADLTNLWEPADIVQKCADWGSFTAEQLYEKWSCGQGALVVIDEANVDVFVEQAKQFGIEAKLSGYITQRDDKQSQLRIISQFADHKRKEIIYE